MSSIPVLSVKRQSFTTRIPTDSVVGTVGAEEVQFQVDDTWKGLQIFAVFANAAMPEQAPVTILLDETLTCAIPWEVLVKSGTILIGLLGKNGTTIVKPTMWLEYSNASKQVPPDGGVDPEAERTKDALDQMVELVQKAKETADNLQASADAGEFNGPEGPPGKSPIIQDGNWWLWDVEAQEYRDTGIAASGGGGGGVSSYNDLSDRPRIGGVLLEGDKTAQDLGLQPKGDYATTSSKLANPFSITFTGAVEATYDGSQEKIVEIPTIAGPAGVSPNVSKEEIDGGTRVVFTFKGGSETVDILNGKTPVKGIDYGTEQEIQEIAQQAAALVPCGGPDGYELIVTDVLKYDSALNFQFGKSYRNVVVTIKVPNGQTVTGDTRFVFDNRMTYFARGRGQYERIEFSFMDKIVRVIDLVGTWTIGSYAVDAYSALLTTSGFAAASNLITLQTLPAETEISVFGVIA